jgi:L-iditol 2-dehydrogenase
MRTTRAGLLVEQGRTVFVESPVEPLQDGDLLVQSEFASICGSDLHVVNQGVETEPEQWVPGYPGHEGVGEVVESRVIDFAAGERVLVVPPVPQARCFAEWQRVRATSAVRLEGACPPLAELMAQQLGTVVFAARQHPPMWKGGPSSSSGGDQPGCSRRGG